MILLQRHILNYLVFAVLIYFYPSLYCFDPGFLLLRYRNVYIHQIHNHLKSQNHHKQYEE